MVGEHTGLVGFGGNVLVLFGEFFGRCAYACALPQLVIVNFGVDRFTT